MKFQCKIEYFLLNSQTINSQHLNILNQRKKMLEQHPKPSSQSPAQLQNITLMLKQKKKQIMKEQQIMNQKIKQYFAQITVQLQDKQAHTLKNLENRMYQLYNNIDQYCAMSENQRNAYLTDIWLLIDRKLDVIENKRFLELLQTEIIQICYSNARNDTDMEMNSSGLSFQQQKTSKKGRQMQYTILKGTYLQQIQQLQQKISKLLLKQDKLKIKLNEMQSKLKMKKLGNAYLPYQQKPISTLLLQRLQSQNKILIQQIADSSEKILSLRSQNCLLIKQRQNSQILTGTDKRKACQSIQVIQQSVQYSQYQQKINILEIQIQNLHSRLQKEKEIMAIHFQQVEKEKRDIIGEYEAKIQQISLNLSSSQHKRQQDNKSKAQLQKKLTQYRSAIQEQKQKLKNITKQLESSKQMNNNYGKLLKIKDDKILQFQVQITKYQQKQKQSQDKYKAMYVQLNQKLEQKQNTIKIKLTEIDSYKSVVKKEQGQKNQYKAIITSKQQQLYNIQETIKSLQAQINKLSKQKQIINKKQAAKIKKQLKKAYEDNKVNIIQDFKVKYNEIMQKIQCIKKESIDNKQKYQKKFKLYELRMQSFKDKTLFQMKEMMEKLVKPAQKQKLFSVIESYIQNQASIALKNSQIKMLKQEIAALKKPNIKKQLIKANNQIEVCQQLQQFEKKLFIQKMEIQQRMYQGKIKLQQQQYELKLQEKSLIIQNLTSKSNSLEKNIKQLKNQLALMNSTTNPQLIQLKKTKEQWSQKQQRMQSLVSSLKNNLNKVQNQAQQAKQQLKLKKDLIIGLKKQIKDKEAQKAKLNEVISSLMDQAEKIKKTKIQANKKQAIFSEFKDKLINQSQLSQQICQLRTTLEQKQKQYKLQISKKQQIIKEMKVNQDTLNKKVKNLGTLQDQIVDLKQKLKKSKIQIERKDTLIQHLKEKQQKTSNQLVAASQSTEAQLKRSKKQLQIQKSKNQAMRIRIGKIQTNYQLLKLSLSRIYEDMCQKVAPSSTSIQKDYTSFKSDGKKTRYEFTVQKTPQITDINKYRQALSILQISSQDFDIGTWKNTDMYSPIPHKTYLSVPANDSIKLTKLLDSQDIDSKAIVQVFTLVLQS